MLREGLAYPPTRSPTRRAARAHGALPRPRKVGELLRTTVGRAGELGERVEGDARAGSHPGLSPRRPRDGRGGAVGVGRARSPPPYGREALVPAVMRRHDDQMAMHTQHTDVEMHTPRTTLRLCTLHTRFGAYFLSPAASVHASHCVARAFTLCLRGGAGAGGRQGPA